MKDLYYNSLRILVKIPPACRVVQEGLFPGSNNPPPIMKGPNIGGQIIDEDEDDDEEDDDDEDEEINACNSYTDGGRSFSKWV